MFKLASTESEILTALCKLIYYSLRFINVFAHVLRNVIELVILQNYPY